MYELGRLSASGLTPDLTTARRWYEKAAAAEDPNADQKSYSKRVVGCVVALLIMLVGVYFIATDTSSPAGSSTQKPSAHQKTSPHCDGKTMQPGDSCIRYAGNDSTSWTYQEAIDAESEKQLRRRTSSPGARMGVTVPWSSPSAYPAPLLGWRVLVVRRAEPARPSGAKSLSPSDGRKGWSKDDGDASKFR